MNIRHSRSIPCRKTNKRKVESDEGSSLSEGEDGDDQGRKKARKECQEQIMCEMIAAAVRQEVAWERDRNEDMIAKMICQEVARTTNADNTPNLPEGNNLVTIDLLLFDVLGAHSNQGCATSVSWWRFLALPVCCYTCCTPKFTLC